MPTAVPESTPYTMIGPATVNIFAARPVMRPSVLNSSAGEQTLLANPVMGTMEPAPAAFPNLSSTVSYTPLRAHETAMELVCRLLLE